MSSFDSGFTGNQAQAAATFFGGMEIRTYSGTAPASCNAALSGNTALSTHTGYTANASANDVNFTIPSDTIDASGTVTFVRIYDGATCRFQDEVGAGVTVDDVNFIEGGTASFSSFKITCNG